MKQKEEYHMEQQVVSQVTHKNSMDTYKEITIEEANQLVGSLKSLYTGQILKGYYLPKYESAYLVKQASKIDIYPELFQIIGQEVELSFTSDKLPDRQWLINILYHVSPNHLYFKQPSSKLIHGLTQSDIQKIKELNTTLFRSKRLRFFKSQSDQKIQRQANQIKAKITKIKTQMEEGMKKQTSKVGKQRIIKNEFKKYFIRLTSGTNRFVKSTKFLTEFRNIQGTSKFIFMMKNFKTKNL